jgi:mono/diheme cytochrome c family protein
MLLLTLCACAAFSGCGATAQKAPTVTDPDPGASVYAANCAVCHGPTGEEGGTLGPGLRNERSRMDLSQLQSWIRDPAPPMPKLYPKYLTDDDVRDVAQYVHSL